jgi:hypothetical protein
MDRDLYSVTPPTTLQRPTRSGLSSSPPEAMEAGDEERKKCAQDVFFASRRSLSEHAIRLHGATFTGEDSHQADHRFSGAVRGNMELKAGAAYKISNLILFDHVHDERGYAVVRYFPAVTRKPHEGNGHERLL